jgi:hypothetical protein
MAGPVCVQCGQPLAEGSRFCGQCGATQPQPGARTLPSAGTQPAQVGQGGQGALGATMLDQGPPAFLQATVLGAASPLPSSPGMPVAPVAPPGPAPAGAGAAASTAPGTPTAKHTMLGMASPFAAPAAAASPAPAPAPAPAPVAHKTMLGVASPLGAMPYGAPAPAPVPAPAPAQVAHKTMLGVASPISAPTASAPGASAVPAPAPSSPAPVVPPKRGPAATQMLQVAYAPPPAPLEELKAPPPPVVVKKSGVPLAMVALIAGGLLLVGGVTIALLWKSAPPMTAQARSAADGSDLLHLTCDARSCPDGTTAALGASKATFAGGQADLPVPTPLHLGDNDLSLLVDRPGMGRDETMKFVVPVAYRVRADVTTMSSPRPSITVRVEARPGTDVKVDGKPVALDPNGAGAYVVDESAAGEGAADESRVVSLDLPYAITPPAASKVPPENGTVSARVAISPLRVDAPGPIAVVEDDHVLIAGRGPKGASVTVDGNVVTVAADGSFETTVPLPNQGDHVAEVRGGTPALMPRTVHVTVTRVASLADAAKAFEQSRQPIGYDVAMSDIAGKTGQPIVVEGPVLESRASGHRTLVLVDDRRGCKKGPCHARVVVGRDLALAPGDVLHAYGTVARGFTTPQGQTVPEIDSQFALRTKK